MNRYRTKAWCDHYRGMHNRDTCEAGVAFASLPKYGTREFHDACPCFGPRGGCDKAEYPTPEQLEENKRRLEVRLRSIGNARAAIVDHLGGPWKRGTNGSSGVIDCPVCGAADSLHFSRSGYNGHIDAVCATDGCVRWME